MTIAIISDEFCSGFVHRKKDSEDDLTLINALRQEKNWSSQRLLRKVLGKNWA